jgi:hypothetical protein
MAQLARRRTSIRLRDLLLAHAPGVLVAALIAPPVWLVRWTLIELGLGPLAVLGGGALTCAVVFLLLLHKAPRLVLGPDGIWVLEALLAKVPTRNRATFRRVLGRALARPVA